MASNVSPLLRGEVITTPGTMREFEWKIQDFESLIAKPNGIHSPFFSFAGVSWMLGIVPIKTESGYFSLCLARKHRVPPISLEVSFSFKTSDGKECPYRYNTNYSECNSEGEVYVTCSSVKTKELLQKRSELLPSNVLTVLCTVTYLKSTKDASESCSLGSSISPYENKVLHDFKELFLKKEDCDVVLNVQGQEFSAHKNILKARSPVFASTFRIDMKEKKTGIIEIEDCDPFSFSDFLCFLYCGDTEVISEENVFSLFTSADKYDVQDLRTKCMEFIKENLSVDTFCDTITLALRHSERELIKTTTDFFIENASKIILTVKWQTFLAENPTESNELLVKFFASNNSNSSK